MDQQAPSENPPHYIAAARKNGMNLRQSAPIRKGPARPPPLKLPILDYLRSKRVILASASPRRKALLAQVGLANLEVIPSSKPEDIDKKGLTPFEYVSATAHQKCLDVYESAVAACAAGGGGGGSEGASAEPDVVIAADTVVVTRGGKVLEKPGSPAEHGRMLRTLRDAGGAHTVLTCVCALAPRHDASHPGYELAAHTEETRVFFDPELADEVLDAYVATREGADKAGGYALQGVGGLVLVERIEGSVDNVVGLPVRQCLRLCEKVVFRQGEEEQEGEDED